MMFRPGPDAGRYLLAGNGHRVAVPFNVRWLLPKVCGGSELRWRVVWLCSWPALFSGTVVWALTAGVGVWRALACAVFLVALPGIWGPSSVRPVGVDLPAMAVAVWAAAAFINGQPIAGFVLLVIATAIKEHAPVWVALWAWSLLPLAALVVVPIAFLVFRPELDAITSNPVLKRVHDHPVRAAWEHHKGQWRNAWIMVAPWGATLAALVSAPVQVWVALALGYGQLLIATDSVRLFQTVAGPVMCLAAAQIIPLPWLLLAVVAHACFWRDPVCG